MEHLTVPSPHLYYPTKNRLQPYQNQQGPIVDQTLHLNSEIETQMKSLILQKNYPCVAALKSYHSDEYQVGIYEGFGKTTHWRELRNDLLYFLKEQQKTKSTYLTFWAIFPNSKISDEVGFESQLWQHLSLLTSEEQRTQDWGPGQVTDPNDPSFCFSIASQPFFVVGLHPHSSRRARRFPYPAVLFNVMTQFETLEEQGLYDAMVASNRSRDLKFQGSVNPMALRFGDEWESIQFSGRENTSEWKCPFHFMSAASKKSLEKPN